MTCRRGESECAFGSARRPPRSHALLAHGALVGLLTLIACPEPPDGAPVSEASVVSAEPVATEAMPRDPADAAVARGIDWFLANEPAMPTEWAASSFIGLSRVVADPELAASLRDVAERRSQEPLAELPREWRHPALLRWRRLRPLVAELSRRRRVGEPFEAQARALGASIRAREPEFWRDIQPAPRLVLLHELEELGVATARTTSDEVHELRKRWVRGEKDALLLERRFMFAVTHVFYNASGYLQRGVDAGAFGPERKLLRRALKRYLAGPLPESRFFLDLQAELLVCLRLLGEPEDADVRAMQSRLLSLQNADGSWGEPVGQHQAHATLAVIQALVDFTPRLAPPESGGANAPG